MIKNIFLDLDDTIFDFKIAEGKALTKTLEQLGIEPKEEIVNRYSVINDSQWKLLELGKLTRDEVKVRRYQLLFEEIGSDASAQEASDIYAGYLAQGHYFVDGAEEMLVKLHHRFRLYLVSNGTSVVQHGRLESSDIEKYFEEIFISEEIGYNKPSKEFFTHCFSQISDFKKEESVIIGDSLSSDIQGGINAGITTIWFNLRNHPEREDVIPDYTIHHLSEVCPLVGLK